jgi:hypothetical protein
VRIVHYCLNGDEVLSITVSIVEKENTLWSSLLRVHIAISQNKIWCELKGRILSKHTAKLNIQSLSIS